jgi:hypothetical protein
MMEAAAQSQKHGDCSDSKNDAHDLVPLPALSLNGARDTWSIKS